jgi:hypothetical protein
MTRLWEPWVYWAYGAGFDRKTEDHVPEAGLQLRVVETGALEMNPNVQTPTDGRNVRTSRSTSQPTGVSAIQWEHAPGVLKPALHTDVPSPPRAVAPRLFVT